MDKLNKLRLLAGVPVRYTPSTPSKLMEARAVPQRKADLAPQTDENMKARAALMNTAAMHVAKAIEALEKIPATNFMGDVPHFIAELTSLLDGDQGDGGMKELVGAFQTEYRSWKRKSNALARANEAAPVSEQFEIDPPAEDDEHIQDPSEFAELSADADAAAYGEMGGEEDVTSPEVVAKIAAYAQEAGFGSEEGLPGDELGDVADDALVGDERTLGDEELGDDLGDEEFPDDEFDGPADPLDGEDPGAADLEDPGYGEDDGRFSEFDESAPAVADKDKPKKKRMTKEEKKEKENEFALMQLAKWAKAQQKSVSEGIEIKDKDESPNQLHNLEPSPGDHDKKVHVPAAVKQALRDEAAQARKEAKELGATDKDAKWFYENLATAFEELLGHLEKGTVYDIKKAQIFMTSLMGPMLHKIPAEVVNFVAKGGAERKLSDYMKPVDKKYPVTGKMYTGE